MLFRALISVAVHTVQCNSADEHLGVTFVAHADPTWRAILKRADVFSDRPILRGISFVNGARSSISGLTHRLNHPVPRFGSYLAARTGGGRLVEVATAYPGAQENQSQ